jgi:hypothetical protein
MAFKFFAIPLRDVSSAEPAALPFRQDSTPDGQKDRRPPGVSSTRERSGWSFAFPQQVGYGL